MTPRYDVIYVLDDQGWFYQVQPPVQNRRSVKPGRRSRWGRKSAFSEKRAAAAAGPICILISVANNRLVCGASKMATPLSGKRTNASTGPRLLPWQGPIAWAGPGDIVELDATRSWSRSGTIKKFEWTFCDGTSAAGPKVQRTYGKPGEYNEILKVIDASGNVDYDFAVVQMLRQESSRPIAADYPCRLLPTFDIKPGDEVTFKVRSFRTRLWQ